MEPINLKIKNIRNSKGISQTVVAETCGIKQSSYANIENGKTQSITIEIGKGIAKALGVSFNELFDIEQPSDHTELFKMKIKELSQINRDFETKIDDLQLLNVQLIIIIYTKDIFLELMSFGKNKEFKNDRKKQIEKLKELVDKKRKEIEDDFSENIYSPEQYKRALAFMNRMDSSKYLNLFDNIDFESLLNKYQYYLYPSRTG